MCARRRTPLCSGRQQSKGSGSGAALAPMSQAWRRRTRSVGSAVFSPLPWISPEGRTARSALFPSAAFDPDEQAGELGRLDPPAFRQLHIGLAVVAVAAEEERAV